MDQHPGSAVEPALWSLADVMEERGGDEVGVVVAAFEDPEGGAGGVDDVAGMLLAEKLEQGRAQMLPGDSEIGGCGYGAGVGELREPAEDHTRSRNTWL